MMDGGQAPLRERLVFGPVPHGGVFPVPLCFHQICGGNFLVWWHSDSSASSGWDIINESDGGGLSQAILSIKLT